MNFAALLRSLKEIPGTVGRAFASREQPIKDSEMESLTKLRKRQLKRNVRNAMASASRRKNRP